MPGQIEFFSGPEPDDHDDAERRPEAPRRNPLVWIVIAALVAAVAVWVATRPTGTDQPAAQPARTVTVEPSPSPSPERSMITMQRTCTSGRPINPQLVLIARRNLPGMTLLPDESFRCTTGVGPQHRIASESIAVRYQSVVIEILASRRVGDDGQYQPTPSQRGLIPLATTESQSAGLNVLVGLYGRPGNRRVSVPMDQLASDVSLQLVL